MKLFYPILCIIGMLISGAMCIMSYMLTGYWVPMAIVGAFFLSLMALHFCLEYEEKVRKH